MDLLDSRLFLLDDSTSISKLLRQSNGAFQKKNAYLLYS